MKKIIVDSCEYEITPAFIKGFIASSECHSYKFPPYEEGTEELDDWQYGYMMFDSIISDSETMPGRKLHLELLQQS